MFVLRMILSSILTVFVVVAIPSGTASAACGGEGHKSVWCAHNGGELHKELFVGTSGLTLYEISTGGISIKFHCISGALQGTLSLLGASEGKIHFLGCSVVNPPRCVVVESLIAFGFTAQLSEGTVPATDLYQGSNGDGFASFSVAGPECGISGKFQIAGLQTFELPEGEVSKTEHEFVAKKSGSKLLGVGATLWFTTTEKVKLTSGLPWLVGLGS